MAAARHNRPTIIVYGGTIQPGVRHVDCEPLGFKAGDAVNIGQTFETWGEYLSVSLLSIGFLNISS